MIARPMMVNVLFIISSFFFLCNPSFAEAEETLAPVTSSPFYEIPNPTAAPALNYGPETLKPTVGPETLTPTETPEEQETSRPNGPEGLEPTTVMPSPQPSASPTATATPTLEPTTSQTKSPTEQPTSAPVSPPTGVPKAMVPVFGTVELEISSTSSLLIGDSEGKFLLTAEVFLKLKLPRIEYLTVEVVRQYKVRLGRRNLQGTNSPLFVDLAVSGRQFLSFDETEELDFDETLQEVFQKYGYEYILALKATGDPYFDSFEVMTLNNAGEETSAPVSAPVVPDSPTAYVFPYEEADVTLSVVVIVGIAVGGVVVLVLAILLCRKLTKKTPDTSFNQTTAVPRTPSPKKKWGRKKKEETPQHNSTTQGSIKDNGSDLESQAQYSYALENESFMGGSIMHNDMSMSIVGPDAISYAYSLEPGIAQSVTSGSTFERTRTFEKRNDTAVPTEIPQKIQKKKKDKQPESRMSSTNGSSELDLQPTLSSFDETNHISLAPSELRLTESELAMLPSNLGNSSSEEGPMDLPSHQVIAPSGKLGIVIDTTVEGPVVHNVNEGSSLQGLIWPGDIIVAIDDVDTRAMSASAITALMVKTANQQRRLTVISDPNRYEN